MSPPKARWRVSRDDPKRAADLVARITSDGSDAIVEGRVFVDGRRLDEPTRPLVEGQWVELFARRTIAGEVAVLLQRGGLVAVHKPAGVATEPELRGSRSLRGIVAEMLDEPETRVHAASRLDVGVSGVVLFTLTANTRREIESARAEARLRRRYVAIASGSPSEAHGLWNRELVLKTAPRRARAGTGSPETALTRFDVKARSSSAKARAHPPSRTGAGSGWSLIALEPVTGRTHQLRIHAAQAGAPLLGDGRYGAPERIVFEDGSVESLSRVALHAARVELVAPRERDASSWAVHAPDPDDLVSLWIRLGGGPLDWARAADEALRST